MQTKSTFIAWATVSLAVIAVMLPAVLRPMMLHDSFWIDHVWASQFTELLREGTAYPRWLPKSHDGLGSPVFYYYPPLAFYITGAFGLGGLSTYTSILAAFALAFFVSGLGVWYWLRGHTQYPLLGALFFTLAPYHCFDFYGRGALAESVAIAILPYLAIGLQRIAAGKGWLLAAVAYAALILSHLPLALLTSVFLIAPYSLLNRAHWVGFGYACFAGVGLTAIYLVPALGLGSFRDTALLWSTPLLRPAFWSIYAANWKSPAVLQFHLTVVALLVPTLPFAILYRNRAAQYALGILIIGLGAIPLLWSLWPLRTVQFPYRILPLAELGLALAIASQGPLTRGLRVSLLALPMAWSATITQMQRGMGPGLDLVVERYVDVAEYLPPGAKDKPSAAHWYDQVTVGRMPPPEVRGWVVEPVFYFPSWTCGQPEPTTKLLMHRPGCEPRIGFTTQEKIGTLVSLMTLLFASLHLLLTKRRLTVRDNKNAR